MWAGQLLVGSNCGKGVKKHHTRWMNMDDISLEGNSDANEASSRHVSSKHLKIPEAALARPALVPAESVKFSLVKAQQSDQIKTSKARVYSPLLMSVSETLQIPVAGPIMMFTLSLRVRKQQI